MLSGLDTATKEVARKELGWLGFGQLSANILAHPAPDIAELDVTIKRIGVADQLVVLEGQTIRNEPGMRQLAHNGWNLAAINARYEQFLEMFRPIMKAAGQSSKIEEKQAFIARTLLIQEYRKVLLRDPQLPQELLPTDWKGAAAYQLCRNLYLSTHHEADRYLDKRAGNDRWTFATAGCQYSGHVLAGCKRPNTQGRAMTDLERAKRCADAMWSDDNASHALGIEIEVTGVGTAIARMTIRDDMVNGLDVCHGGLVFALGDTAFAIACNAYDSAILRSIVPR